jgi:hypothetical protein
MRSLRTNFARWFITSVVPVISVRLNPPVIRVLESRYHRLLDWYVAVVRFPGRRSGRTYVVPFTFCRVSDTTVQCVTSRKGVWWRNLVGSVDADLLRNGRWRPARGESIEDLDVVRNALAERDLPRRLLLAVAPEDGVLVRITLNNGGATV